MALDCADVQWNIDYDGEDFEIEACRVKLAGMTWKPEGTPKFNYVFVHGLSVFTTFKKDFFPFILNEGGQVFATDHLGHGRSPGSRVSCSIDEIVEETEKVILYAEQTNPDLPLILHGHSMGGLTILTLALKHPDFVRQHVSGLVAEAPWISSCPQRQPGCCLMGCIRFISWFCPRLGIDGGVSHFSADNDRTWVNLISNSQYFAPVTTPRNYLSAQDTIKWLRQHRETWPQDVPLLFVQGRNDDLVNAQESEVWISALISEHPDSDITFKMYDGPHVMLKTPVRRDVITEMMGFITRIVNKEISGQVDPTPAAGDPVEA